GRPSIMEKSTVVSSVLGKQLPNIQAISWLPMWDCTSWMARSTATLLNLRLLSGVRTTGNSEVAAKLADETASAEAASVVLRIKSLRFINLVSLGIYAARLFRPILWPLAP